MKGYFDRMVFGMVPTDKRTVFMKDSTVQFPHDSPNFIGSDYGNLITTTASKYMNDIELKIHNDHRNTPNTGHAESVKLVIIILSVLMVTIFTMACIMCILIRARSKRKLREARRRAVKRMPSLSTDKYMCNIEGRRWRKNESPDSKSHVVLHVHLSLPTGADNQTITGLQVPSEVNLSTDTMETPPPPYPGEYPKEEQLPYIVEEP